MKSAPRFCGVRCNSQQTWSRKNTEAWVMVLFLNISWTESIEGDVAKGSNPTGLACRQGHLHRVTRPGHNDTKRDSRWF